MALLQYTAVVLVSIPVAFVLLYATVRVAARAWFYTKKQFNERNGN